MVPTASGSSAVQVVRYQGKQAIILKHIGSVKDKRGVLLLKKEAYDWIKQTSGQESLFLPEDKEQDYLLGKYRYIGFFYGLVHETIRGVFKSLGLDTLSRQDGQMLLDLALIRTVKPVSKRQSQKLLSKFFGINYTLTDIYRSLKSLSRLKSCVEDKLVSFAKTNLGFNFSFVFYDITTLYFETFTSDDLRKCGFSKDNKIGQPQILVGLIVNKDGFPLSFAVFEGNKFEGHTLIPVILALKKRHKISTLTVVADAAMISRANIQALTTKGLSYIVGARLGNMNWAIIQQISQELNKVDKALLRLKVDNGFLICSYSAKRYAKDKHEMKKQLKKAESILTGKTRVKRNKFLTKESADKYCLNTSVIKKTKLLLGIKGYHSNLSLPEKAIIERYKDLWRVEQAFKISKNDLAIRPIYHFKKQAIIAHILICIIALAVLKFMEIKTGKSAKYIMQGLKSVTDGRILNTITGKETHLRSEITKETQQLIQKLELPH